jgi:excisionase family DNA binding protein
MDKHHPPEPLDVLRAAKATASQERARRCHERREKIAKRVARLAFSVDEVAVALGRDPATIWRWVKAGTVASVKVGGSRMIPAAELRRIAGQGTDGGADR